MFLFEKQKIYTVWKKSEGYSCDVVKDRLSKSVRSTGEHIIKFTAANEFKICKPSAMRNSFNWTLFGDITENEDEIVIKGHFGFEQYVKVLAYIFIGFGLVMLLASLFLKSGDQVSEGIAKAQQIDGRLFGSMIGSAFIISMPLSLASGKLMQREKQEEMIELIKHIEDGGDVWDRW